MVEAHRAADRLFLDLQEEVMKIRMVPLGPTFRQFFRAVRDVATASGKQAHLELSGEDVDVDTNVIEHLRDPLTHLVRNAVDHGIESPEVRLAAGKDPSGRVHLQARHEGGSIVIQVQDDGAGLDRARIIARARAHGDRRDLEAMPDGELFRLILEPGFSTAERVTEFSGRGVGMDVVRRNVERLRGSIAVDGRPGAGSTITLRLPLTLAIIRGFSVGVGDDTYVVPLDSVVECLEFPREAGHAGARRAEPARTAAALPAAARPLPLRHGAARARERAGDALLRPAGVPGRGSPDWREPDGDQAARTRTGRACRGSRARPSSGRGAWP